MSVLTLSPDMVYRGSLILVNPEYGFRSRPDELLIPALETRPEILLQRCASTLLNRLMQEIQGWRSIVPVSGWRSLEEQQQIWDDTLRENGPEFTKKFVALPGHSEHQTGLAIDLGLKQEQIDFICPDFPDSGICGIFRKKAAEYGFILRYPAGKEVVTGIGHEPWHFRYVGAPHARIMKENGLTLEEYTEFVRQFPFGHSPCLWKSGNREIAVSYIKAPAQNSENAAASGTIKIELSDRHPYTVSGNNVDGFVLTEWIR